jgi:V/A-type H+-transporting ATPase subunit D
MRVGGQRFAGKRVSAGNRSANSVSAGTHRPAKVMESKTPTRSALLELKEERLGLQEGYQFLDEKRLILAAEIMRELEHYDRINGELHSAFTAARDALHAAVTRHGLEGLQVYPAMAMPDARLDLTRRSVLGLPLQAVALDQGQPLSPAALHASPEAERCRQAFAGLVPLAAALAGISGNLLRLREEYRRTARRSRALEDVLLPEIDTNIAAIDSALEELDREDIVRVRRLMER